jgi:hypothetical protein
MHVQLHLYVCIELCKYASVNEVIFFNGKEHNNF